MGVSAQATKIHLAVAAWEWGSYFPMEQRLKGIRLTMAQYTAALTRRRRRPRAKAAGLYMICTIEKHRAERAGYSDALMLDWRGRVAECTGANIFLIKDGVIHTPDPDCFLDGITRRTVIELAKKRGYQVIERAIMPEELWHLHRSVHHRHRRRGDAGLRDRRAQATSRAQISETLLNDYMAAVRPKTRVAAE